MTTNRDGILIVGGYGHVGRAIAARLLRAGCLSVRLGGRNAGRARNTAEALGCQWTTIDLTQPESWPAALEGMGTVVVCMDQRGPDFVAAVLGRGLSYVDISASDAFFRQAESLQELARARGGRAVLSVGLAPGLTNLMARACVIGLTHVERMEIGVLLGPGDTHGAGAIEWSLQNLRPHKASSIRSMAYGASSVRRASIPFDFADQQVLARRHGLAGVTTRLALDSALATGRALRFLGWMARSSFGRGILRWAFSRLRWGSDRAALAIEAIGRQGDDAVCQTMTFEGRKEAEITALMAAETILRVRRNAPDPGIWHLQELFSVDDFAARIREEGYTLQGPQIHTKPE